MKLHALSYKTGKPVEITVECGKIVNSTGSEAPDAPHAELPWIAPGFVDVQVNGYGGQEFSSLDLSPEAVAKIVRKHFEFGVTALCPTLTTQASEVFEHALATIDEACRTWPDVDHAVWGIHLEGPFLSAEDGPRGAHPAVHCRPPDWESFLRWQEAAQGRIRLITLSPEYESAPDFTRRATATGVAVGLGHLAANGEQIRAAVDAGARFSTHLGNGAHRMLRRHPNYLWDQLAEDRLTAGLICDGQHLPPEVVKTFIRTKTPEKCFIVSDVSGLAGLPPGKYDSSGCELEILSDGRLVIAGQDQLLAGASLPIGIGIKNAMRFAGLSLATAVEMATLNPARLLNRHAGSLANGDAADFVLFNWKENTSRHDLEIVATILGGEVVYDDGTSFNGNSGISSPPI